MPFWTCRPSRLKFAVSLSAAALLLIPVVPPAWADQAVHVVEPGETLSQIALDLGTDVDSVARLNEMDASDVLVAGSSIKVPAGSGQLPTAVASNAPGAAATASSGSYVVAEGDTLWSIAQQFGTTAQALVEANRLEDADTVRAGMELRLPSGSAGGGSAPAPPSAPAATASPEPAVASQPVAPSAPAPPPSRRTSLVPYTVQPGETLNQIARQFDVRPAAIVEASGLEDPNRIRVGSVLKVPLPGREHTVEAGETLRDIAAQEKVDLGALIDFNELDDPSLIRVGQVVLVPAAASQQAATSQPAQVASAPASGPASGPAPSPSAAPSAAPPPPPSPSPSASGSAQSPQPQAKATPSAAAKAPTRPPATPPPGAPADGLAGAALKFLGAPYVFGGSSPSGFDCSGFVWYVARQAGKSVNRGLLAQYSGGSHPSKEELKPGDLVFFQNTYTAGLSHNGIYLGDRKFVHAADESTGVTISSLDAAYWSSHWFGASRI